MVRMSTVALVTSIYGDYDHLVDPPKQHGVDDYVAVVDRFHDGCSLWRQVVEPRPHLHPRMAAKVAKCLPWRYTDAETTIWVDGSARLLHEEVASWAIAHGPFAQFRHPARDDILAEAHVSAGMRKYEGQPVVEQAVYYQSLGLPKNFGLWACGFIVRRNPLTSRARLARFGQEWLTEQMVWSWQDQISEPYLLWRQHYRPADLDGDLWGNPHVCFAGHRSEA